MLSPRTVRVRDLSDTRLDWEQVKGPRGPQSRGTLRVASYGSLFAVMGATQPTLTRQHGLLAAGVVGFGTG
jgi:hypothetical protein